MTRGGALLKRTIYTAQREFNDNGWDINGAGLAHGPDGRVAAIFDPFGDTVVRTDVGLGPLKGNAFVVHATW